MKREEKTIEILIATMHQTDYSLLDRMNISSSAVVINQCDSDSVKRFNYKEYPVVWVNTTQRGLSKSRNMALSYATADICLIADDDEVMANGYSQIILSEFKKKESVDIVAFAFNAINRDSNRGKLRSNKCRMAPRFRYYASVCLAFKLNTVKKHGIYFNEFLGAGTKYGFGEETAWQEVCKRRGLKIYESDKVISDVYFTESSWFNGYDEDFYVSTGVLLSITYGRLAYFFMFYYVYQSMSLSTMSLSNVMKSIVKGIRTYQSL